jgi:hypothetical protein
MPEGEKQIEKKPHTTREQEEFEGESCSCKRLDSMVSISILRISSLPFTRGGQLQEQVQGR